VTHTATEPEAAARPAGSSGASPLLVDAHVHLHSCFEPAAFLAAAAANFRGAAAGLGIPQDTPGYLLLADSGEEQGLARLRASLGGGGGRGGAARPDGWTVHDTAESCAVLARYAGQVRLLVIAGQQVSTREGLEVLALLTGARLPDGLALRSAIGAARDVGAVPVVPWGFGKWTLGRGRAVAAVLRSHTGPLFLGDNGGRPRGLPIPRLLGEARRSGVLVLPGSDPLPFPDHEGRAGSFGFMADLAPDPGAPAAGLREWLLGLRVQPRTYGRARRPDRFLGDQVRMQVWKGQRRHRR
jgi:hypothetical protein